MKIQVDEIIRLEMLEEIHAESLLNVVNANRNSLREWLPWVDHMQTDANFAYYRQASSQFQQSCSGGLYDVTQSDPQYFYQ